MNPVDNNINVRPTRSDSDPVNRRGADAVTNSRPAPGSAKDAASVSDGESVSITGTATELLSLENQLKALPGVDQARVDSIREAISNGSYSVDPERIVDSLLKSEVELG
ncbi:flagellar biosynthesis anti-sigma factor FlgM [Congregibacter litoralis]|uniref:Negative regulator of flagellin synthesis n=1 Tax=Congregibacter litoralis KT71 TaxID=314285 RepID=A4A620_9GAMM|nr:flagellar biosynthesis anti-sigma factor FlgM [Congregibacter litoralis]EAQ98467.1 anti-sigma-28 factor, FlgM family [Congregibacter litoralis KT71]